MVLDRQESILSYIIRRTRHCYEDTVLRGTLLLKKRYINVVLQDASFVILDMTRLGCNSTRLIYRVLMGKLLCAHVL